MVVGSFGCTIFAIIPLVQQYESFYKSHDDLLPAVDFKITWALLIFSGFFFTLGSFAFVRCSFSPLLFLYVYFILISLSNYIYFSHFCLHIISLGYLYVPLFLLFVY